MKNSNIFEINYADDFNTCLDKILNQETLNFYKYMCYNNIDALADKKNKVPDIRNAVFETLKTWDIAGKPQ